jgi:cytochrome c
MRDLPYHQCIRPGPPGADAVQDRRQAGGQGGRLLYSGGFAKADFVWDDTRLDAYLANPQAMVPGSIMAYRQPKPETRAAIIAYLKELN